MDTLEYRIQPGFDAPRIVRRRIGSVLICALLGVLSSPTWADTYYVRTDGGDARQCDGMADRAYPGSGGGQACAWIHPFMALPPGGEPRMSGGDTLIIGAGQYRMGIGAPGSERCHPAHSWDCHMPPLPGGSDSGHPTRILGSGHGSGCTAAPILWGTERASVIIDLEDVDHVEIACLEITDRSSCIEFHCHAGDCTGEVLACERDHSPFGAWASTGIRAVDASDILLTDIEIHGLAGRGIQAGRIGDWRLERVRLIANGWAGWDGDVGTASANHGRLYFKDVEIAYNGCAETWPDSQVRACWAQAAGGYGDGLGTAKTGGDWVFERVRIHHNTSDGLDLAYLDASGKVTVNASLFEGNAGNQVKIAASARISNSVVIANCGYFAESDNFADWDLCRAGGDAIFLGLGPGIRSELVNNSMTGEGNCLVSSAGPPGGRLSFTNNLFHGQPARGLNRSSCHFYSDQADADISWRANLVVNAHRSVCAPDNLCPRAAGIRNPHIDDFDPTPLSGSAMIGSADPAEGLPGDFWGLPRPSGGPHTIGAIGPLGSRSAMHALRLRLQRDTPIPGAAAARSRMQSER